MKNESDAEDLVQETFFTVMMKLPTLSDANSFQAWVNRIAVNKCKNFLSGKSTVSFDEKFTETGDDLPDEEISLPDEYVANEEKRKIIMDIIMSSLSDVQRQTVIMYYYDEMTTAEISQAMNCPIGTVTYRLSSARKVIKEEILRYEKVSKDRLHSVSAVPFLTSLLRAEAENLHIPKPDLSQLISSAADISAAAQSTYYRINTDFTGL
ncbi:MAG: RNA polymerase sigma factor [Porcipelethomonas sp.]